MNKPLTQLELVPAGVVDAKQTEQTPPPKLKIKPHPAVDLAPDDGESSDFDWVKDKPDVVLPEQPATAVYRNPRGDVVVRQERHDGEDDDVVIVRPENLAVFIAALKRHLP